MRPRFHRDDVPGDIVLADMTKRPGSIGSVNAGWCRHHPAFTAGWCRGS
jgi:hypothetical protein